MNGRQLALAPLLSIQRNQHPSGLRTLGLNDLHDFANSGPCGDHVIDDQHAAIKRRADQRPPFAMVLGFLAVKAPRQVTLVMLSQRDGCRRRQRNTFVGRPEDHIEIDAAVGNSCGVEAAQLCQRRATVEQSGIEEVGAGAPGLQGELTEAQNPALDGEANELALVRLHEEYSRKTLI